MLKVQLNKDTANFASNEIQKPESAIQTITYFIKFLPADYMKRNMLLDVIDTLQANNDDALAITLTDTLLNNYISNASKYGNKFFKLLGRFNSNGSNGIVNALLKDKDDRVKPPAMQFYIMGLAKSGDYYNAYKFIPEYVSSSNTLDIFSTILRNEANMIKRPNSWRHADEDFEIFNVTSNAHEVSRGNGEVVANYTE
ncbi:MAG: hypothetical protein H7257_07320 [Taibaiella sp.]|nr:hypothetical protein [Taibaiella sp.]